MSRNQFCKSHPWHHRVPGQSQDIVRRNTRCGGYAILTWVASGCIPRQQWTPLHCIIWVIYRRSFFIQKLIQTENLRLQLTSICFLSIYCSNFCNWIAYNNQQAPNTFFAWSEFLTALVQLRGWSLQYTQMYHNHHDGGKCSAPP